MLRHANHADVEYLDFAKFVLENGIEKGDRTGTGTISHFGYQMRFNLQNGFPLLTTKRTGLRIIAEELFWFLKGETNIQNLVRKKVHIWDDWPFKKYIASDDYDGPDLTDYWLYTAKDPEFKEVVEAEMDKFCERIVNDDEFAAKYGELGPVYGKQWRSWEGANGETVDQIQNVIEQIKNNPNSRRLIVNAWKVDEVEGMALPPCHMMFQFYVANGKLSCQLYQRSADIFLGIPFNIASYALLIHMIAQVTGLEVGDFVHTVGDAHIYSNHVEQIELQMSREPRPMPTLKLNPEITDIFDFTWDDVEVEGYDPHPSIKGEVAV